MNFFTPNIPYTILERGFYKFHTWYFLALFSILATVQPSNQVHLHQATLEIYYPHIGLGDSSRFDTRRPLLSAEIFCENVKK